MNPESSSLQRLRILGILEGLSFLFLLFIAMPLKYIYSLPIYVRYTGMIHGILFILYVVMLYQEKERWEWSWKKFLVLFLCSNLPFGFLIVEFQKLLQR